MSDTRLRTLVARPTAMRPFHERAVWPPWGDRICTVAVKDLLDAHGSLVVHEGHVGAYHCPCPLAVAIREGLPGDGRGPVSAEGLPGEGR